MWGNKNKIGSKENKWTLTKIITLCRKCDGLRKGCRKKVIIRRTKLVTNYISDSDVFRYWNIVRG